MENIHIYSVLLLNLPAGTLGSVTQYMLSPQNLQTSDSSPPKLSITPIMSNLDQKAFLDFFVVFSQRILSLQCPPLESTCTRNSC